MKDTWTKRTHIYRGLMAGLVMLVLPLGVWASVSGYLPNALINGKTVQRWNDSNPVIAVTVQPAPGLKGWSPDMIGLVKSAFGEWQQAMKGRLKFEFTTDPSKTDILVTWARRSYGTQVGHQMIRYEGTVLTNADVTIALLSPNGQALTKPELRTVALHEIGHALGIRGHSDSIGDVMYPSLQPNVNRLSARDISTMQALYQLKADVTNPKGVHLMAYRQYSYYVTLGYQAFQRKDFASAYDYFKQAKRYYAHDPRQPYLLGLTALNLKKYDEAQQHLEMAAITPGETQNESMFMLGATLTLKGAQAMEKGKSAEAREQLGRAVQIYQAVVQSPKSSADLKRRARLQLANVQKIKV